MKSKKVYLTIDDAPSKDFRDKFNFLLEKNIPAVFFCEGSKLLRYEEDVISALKHGFIIGNHSMNHNYFSDLSYEECKDSILQTDKIINALYKRANVDREDYFFRFPHFDQCGDKSSKDYENKWSKSIEEWCQYPNEKKRKKIQEYLKILGYKQPKIEGINYNYFHDKKMLEHIDVRCTFDQMEYFLGNPAAPYGLSKESNILHRIDEDVPHMGRSLNRQDTSDIILVHDNESTTQIFYKIIEKYIEKGFEFKKMTSK